MTLAIEYEILKDRAQDLINCIDKLENANPKDNIYKYTFNINDTITDMMAFYKANIENKKLY